MATQKDSITTALLNAFASFSRALNIKPHNNNQCISSYTTQFAQPSIQMGQQGQMVEVIGDQQGYATSIQMGNQMQYARHYAGNQMDQIMNQNVVIQNGNACFMTSIQKPTSEIHSSNIGNDYNVKAMTKVQKIQSMLMLANKEESGLPLTAEEYDFMVTTSFDEKAADLHGNYNFMANHQETTSSSDSDIPPTYDSEPLNEVPNCGNDVNPFAHEKPHFVPPEPNYDTYVGD